MKLRDVEISTNAISAKQLGKNIVEVVGTRPITEKDGTITALSAIMLCTHYSRNAIKFPLSEDNKQKIEKLNILLRTHDSVKILLSEDVQVKLYAFLTASGSLLEGVSIRASSFEILEDEESII